MFVHLLIYINEQKFIWIIKIGHMGFASKTEEK
jgi:hypothetical protein